MGWGDGSGQWQLEFTTDLEIGAVGFKYGVLSDPIAISELSSGEALPSRFLWAHQLADKSTAIHSADDNHHRFHARVAAYSWEPEETVQGIDLGWGEYEDRRAIEPWKQLVGLLEYSAGRR